MVVAVVAAMVLPMIVVVVVAMVLSMVVAVVVAVPLAVAAVCLFVLFQQIIDYKKRQYRGEELRPTAQWHYSKTSCFSCGCSSCHIISGINRSERV